MKLLFVRRKLNLPKRFDVISTVSSSCEIRQIELNLIPAFIKSHGHGADERLDSSRRLVVRSSESTSNVLVIKYLDFKCEVFFQLKDFKYINRGCNTYILDDHDEER